MVSCTCRLQGRVALVTGSSSGLGAAIALAFAGEGATVFCVDLYPSPRNTLTFQNGGGFAFPSPPDHHSRTVNKPGTHEKIRQMGGEADYYKGDVTKARDMDLAVRACVQKYQRIDIIVNNAGISVESTHPRILRAHETSEEDFDRTLAGNTKSMFLGCKYAIRQMLEQEMIYRSRGWIVNIASVQGLMPYYGMPSYCASKGAAVMLTKQIALDYAGDLIHCNALCPGFLETNVTQNLQMNQRALNDLQEKHPFGAKLGSIEDVARAAVFLVSDDVAWVTGVPLPVDGGYLLGMS